VTNHLDEKLEEAFRLYHQFAGTMVRTAVAAWLNIDLPISQMRVLFVLSESESESGPQKAITIGKLGEELHVGLPAASRLVERLMQEGLVTRRDDPADRRRTLVGLSPRGEAVMKRVTGIMHGRLRALLGQLSEDDLDALLRGMHALEAVITQQTTPG
jgi:DNA-binding MarR family transcriptional regulator